MKKISVLVTILFIISILSMCLIACEHSHEWSEATCVEPQTCIKCGATQGSVIEHDWSSATCTTAKTCRFCGSKEGKPNGHSVRIGTCAICGEKSTELLPNVSGIINDINNLNNSVGKCGKYLQDSFQFSTDKYQREYVSNARIELYSSKKYVESAIALCGEYEELASVKDNCQKILAVIVDEKIMGEGNYKTIRTEMISAGATLLSMTKNVLNELEIMLA